MQDDEKKGLSTFREAARTIPFKVSLSIAVVFVAIGIIFREPFEIFVANTFDWMVGYLGWTFILGGSVFLIMIVYLILSPLGEIKLGEDDEEPAYSNKAWLAMLFSAGMGIGLLFWGVSEPIWHYMWPAAGEADTAAALHKAMRYSFFHWGLHSWAIYAVVAGSLAYFSYRKGLPMLLSSTLYPILGRRGIEGGWGHAVNIIAVLATLFGIATSLGMGVMQIGGGLETLFGMPNNPVLWLTIIVVVSILAIISTTTGIDRGIKWLSQTNIIVAALLMLLVFVLGPTLFILNLFTHSLGGYLQNLIGMSFAIDAAGAGTPGWYQSWTIFYWAWWIAWAPFVGSFIARVSRGRTIRSFAIGVMVIPTIISMVWFSVFGGAALYMEHFGGGGLAEIVAADEALGFFALLSQFPLGSVLVAIAMVSVAVFFITSSDSGTYVIGMLTSRGNPNPPWALRVTWGALEGAFAAVLIMAGGLGALQTASIVGGFPFMIIMFLMLYCLFKALFEELREGSLPVERARIKAAIDDLRRERQL